MATDLADPLGHALPTNQAKNLPARRRVPTVGNHIRQEFPQAAQRTNRRRTTMFVLMKVTAKVLWRLEAEQLRHRSECGHRIGAKGALRFATGCGFGGALSGFIIDRVEPSPE